MKRVLITAVKIYQVAISPFLGKWCRFEPSCSNYFIDALQKKGLLKGAALGILRITRCNPFCRGGYDPLR